ncbi:MAG: hypothetical protein ACXAEU_17545 [Candidatus Hodarchaeales archaeon]
MPICPNCGSYYVRTPCPACVDLSNEKEEFTQPTVPASAMLHQEEEASEGKDYLVFEKEIIEEERTKIDSKDQLVEDLQKQLAEKDFEIAFLKKSLLKIKEEVDKQVINIKE